MRRPLKIFVATVLFVCIAVALRLTREVRNQKNNQDTVKTSQQSDGKLLGSSNSTGTDSPRSKTRFFENHFGPISETDVSEFEKLLPLPLPASYRQFLLLENGGVARNTKKSGSMMVMFGIYNGPNDLSEHWEESREDLPATVLPIGENGNQDLIGLDLRDGAIYLEGERIASDFADWIRDTIAPFESSGSAEELISDRRFDELDALLKSGQLDINAEAFSGMSLIQYSAFLGEADAVEFFAVRGANPSGSLHAMLKTRSGHLQIIKCLLKHGADIHERDPEGRRVIDIDSPWIDEIVKQDRLANP
ncbi:SMI1/KNR4 family protein [Luteolibacter soli]|uniref:SMI1/KNR4 family protein n=1 Tax=Luteolibacter soli TaxID=3135280 RepID=A0ABU9AT33_9BACT